MKLVDNKRETVLDPSKRIKNLPPIHRHIMDDAYRDAIRTYGAEGIDAATIGDPDVPVPQEALDIFAHYAAKPECQGYQMPSFGGSELLNSGSTFFNRTLGLDLGPETLTAKKGARDALRALTEALTDEHDIVAIPDSHYPGCYNAGVVSYCKLAYYSVEPGTDLLEEIIRCYEDARRTYGRYPKLCIIVPVGNPIGTVLTKQDLEGAVDYLKGKSFIISDEAYICNPFPGSQTFSLAQIKGALEFGVCLRTFSKMFDWPSSRLAFAQSSASLTGYFRQIDSAGQYGHHIGIQKAAIELFSGRYDGFSLQTGKLYSDRYGTAVETCSPFGVEVLPAGAGMFAAVKITERWRRSHTSWDVAATVLRLKGKRVNAGAVHGPGAEGLLRVALVKDVETIARICKGVCEVLTSGPEESRLPSDAITGYTA